MELPNEVKQLDVSDAPGIIAAIEIEYGGRDFEGNIKEDCTRNFVLPTAGALKLTLANGDVFIFCTSEWANVFYFNKQVKV